MCVLCSSQKRLNGGLLKPAIEKCSLSCVYRLRSQCFSFNRLKVSLIFFMPGLRDRRFVWKQNDITAVSGTYSKCA
ncbi:hypothetical protein C3E98_019205 [Pseudomonas sp. MWU13-2625]|nr:hypothetical protein C3E98_019205 [Pseudomonas sp. MWU13-2625]